MKPAIHVVVVAYYLALDLKFMVRSVAAGGEEIRFHIHQHLDRPAVTQAIRELQDTYDIRWTRHKTNRGLARSWNDGLIDAYQEGAVVAFIANDDMTAAEGDIFRLADAAERHPEASIITGHGYDMADDAFGPQNFALAAVPRASIQTVGMFDRNFWPVYWEDVDWFRRAQLMGRQTFHVRSTNIIHVGSKTLKTENNMTEHHKTFSGNNAYYEAKWGGTRGAERFARPWNNPDIPLSIPPADRDAPYAKFGLDRKDIP